VCFCQQDVKESVMSSCGIFQDTGIDGVVKYPASVNQFNVFALRKGCSFEGQYLEKVTVSK
jgi:hypothetical protein